MEASASFSLGGATFSAGAGAGQRRASSQFAAAAGGHGFAGGGLGGTVGGAGFGASFGASFSASGGFNLGGSMSFRSRRNQHLMRSQLTRPHTSPRCNRSNDTPEMRLAEEIARQRSEQRAGSTPALSWHKQSPRFVPKPPERRAEHATPCCDVGSATYFQDRSAASGRAPTCTAFLAPARPAVFASAVSDAAATEASVDRLLRNMRRRVEQRSRDATRAAAAAASATYDDRPRSASAPRRSFLEFEEDFEMIAAAAANAAAAHQHSTTTAIPADARDARRDADGGDGASAEACADPPVDVAAASHVSLRPTRSNTTAADEGVQRAALLALLRRTSPGRAAAAATRGDGDAGVPKQSARSQAAAAPSVSRLTQRVRDEHAAAAADRTSFAHAASARSHFTRIYEPGTVARPPGDRRFGFDDGDDEFGAAAGGGSRFASSSSSSRAPAAHQGVDAMYNVPVELFRHMPTPHLAPRRHHAPLSGGALAGGHRPSSAASARRAGDAPGASKDGAAPSSSTPRAGSPSPPGTRRRPRGKRWSPERAGGGISGATMHLVAFERLTGRERRPLSAGAPSHSGFLNALSTAVLAASDDATGRARHGGALPMRPPSHERRPPQQPKLLIRPRYTAVHARAPCAVLGTAPSPRAPIVIGDRRGHDVPDVVTPTGRSWGGGDAVFIDLRAPLDVDRGVRATFPRAVRDIRMPVKRKLDDDTMDGDVASAAATMS
jgi:hypothetical protein